MGTMSYQFGNIFVQAMENQKRLATQRQQFDQSMNLQREQMAQQESQFSRGHALDQVRTGYEGERVGIEKTRSEREGELHETNRVGNPDRLMVPYGYEEGSFGDKNFLSNLFPWAGHGLMKQDQAFRERSFQPAGDYWVNPQGDYNFIRHGDQAPQGFHRTPEDAARAELRADVNRLTDSIQPKLERIPRRPSKDTLGENLGDIKSVLKDLRGLDARNLTPEQHQRLGLDEITSNVQYHIEVLSDEASRKEIERKIGKKQAHQLQQDAYDLQRQLRNIGVDVESYRGAYVPEFKQNSWGHPLLDVLRVGYEDGGLLNMARSNKSGNK
jgi:hypothetical protein